METGGSEGGKTALVNIQHVLLRENSLTLSRNSVLRRDVNIAIIKDLLSLKIVPENILKDQKRIVPERPYQSMCCLPPMP